ncbi:MAG: conjugal transfer protein TraI [Bacteroidota bacterium]
MKKYMVILPLSAITVFVSLPQGADAQFIVGSVLSSTVGRVIRAIDLKVQRMQNQTIWLQNAQKALENQLSKLKLAEISDWSAKQKDLFGSYYQELWQVKSAIAYYGKIGELTGRQVALVESYERAWPLLKQDKHFTPDELAYMTKVYTGILEASINDLDQILAVIHADQLQMPDAKRLELINKAAEHMDESYRDLLQFNQQNYELSLERAKDANEVQTVRRYYGLE